MSLNHSLWSRVLRAPDGEGSGGAAGGDTPWTASLPETIRGHEAFKDVKDVSDLATRYVSATTPKPFAEQLPEDIRADAVFKDIKDLAGLAKSYKGQAHLLGVPKDQLLRLPTDDKPESWAPIYDKLGRPTKAEEYKLTLPQGAELNKEFATPLFAKAHELGISQKQLDGLYGALRSQGETAQKAAADKAKSDMDAASAALKSEWGQAYDQKMNEASAAIDVYAEQMKIPGLKAALDKTGLGNSPELAKLFASLAANLKEDGKLTGKALGGGDLKSPVEAQQEINALRADKNFSAAYLNKSHPGHKDAVAKMAALHTVAYPQAA